MQHVEFAATHSTELTPKPQQKRILRQPPKIFPIPVHLILISCVSAVAVKERPYLISFYFFFFQQKVGTFSQDLFPAF